MMITSIAHDTVNNLIIDAALIDGTYEVMTMKRNGEALECFRTGDREKALESFKDMVKRYSVRKPTAKMQKLIDSLNAAKLAAFFVRDLNDDGGSCNFDSPAISLPRWREADVKACAEAAGLSVFCWNSWGGKRWVFSVPGPCGQGNCRSTMAEAMTEALQAAGFDAVTYYQMD